METSNSTNAPAKKKKVNALMIVGIILMFAGGPLAAPLKYVVEVLGLVLALVGFIKVRKGK